MKDQQHTPPRLAVRRTDPGNLVVEIAGDWLDRAELSEVSRVEKELGGATVKALDFDTKDLDRWDSALMVRILAIHDLCAKARSNCALRLCWKASKGTPLSGRPLNRRAARPEPRQHSHSIGFWRG
jgi:hypothetical protein